MPSISAQLKVDVDINFEDFLKSKVQLLALKDKKWRPLFVISAKDMAKLFNNKRKRK